ncbi:Caspase-2 [Orchesella cincta]|uniref:Caspase-2 n=1 Tax=Orchesella cincta TaxID=48709 RepID=A0A1D2MFW6_ORCCI|nr:Caspase-2 [Orchesella cincta]
MERWQEQIIRRNLSFLIKNVKCTTTLLSKLEERNVLSPEDVETVDVIPKQIEKSDTLIRLLTQKLHGFEILVRTLCDPDVKQYAPAKLLFEERNKYYEQQGIPCPPPMAFAEIPDVSIVPSIAALPSSEPISALPAPEARLAIESSDSPSNQGPTVFVHPLIANTPNVSVASLLIPSQSQESTQTQQDSYHDVNSELPKELEDVMNGNELDVKVRQPNAQTPRLRCRYALPPKGKGYAFILNIIEIRGQNIRKGAEMDATYMTNLWKGLGYEIFPKNENFREGRFKFEEDIRVELNLFKEKCIEDRVDSIVMFIGSHGYNDVILTSDKNVLDVYDDIIYPLQFSIFETKNGIQVEKRVAKIFINQSCQSDPPQGFIKPSANKNTRTPDVNDTIYIKAQIPKYLASRDIKCGSYFVIVLTYVLMSKAWNTALLPMLEEVQTLLKKVSRHANKDDGHDVCQLSPFSQMGFSHPLYFFTRE